MRPNHPEFLLLLMDVVIFFQNDENLEVLDGSHWETHEGTLGPKESMKLPVGANAIFTSFSVPGQLNSNNSSIFLFGTPGGLSGRWHTLLIHYVEAKKEAQSTVKGCQCHFHWFQFTRAA